MVTTAAAALPSERVRLYGWVENWTEAKRPVRALLFGELVQRTVPVTRQYHCDLYHDVAWINENVNGPTEFFFMARYHGTNIGQSAVIQEEISSIEPRVLYHVALTVDRGEWSVTFTELVRVEHPATAGGGRDGR
jgi:hypothetical protein